MKPTSRIGISPDRSRRARFLLPRLYVHPREKVIDVGPVQVTAGKRKTIPLPPLMGALALGGGLVLLPVGRGGRSRPSTVFGDAAQVNRSRIPSRRFPHALAGHAGQ